MFDNLHRHGKEFGIIFGDRTLLSNFRLSLEASEFARDMGKYEQFHEQIFYAYFTEAMDIGSAEILCDIASGCGLDGTYLMHALKEYRYRSRLDEARNEGLKIQLMSLPTFIINDKHKIVGAQPIKSFTEILDKISKALD